MRWRQLPLRLRLEMQRRKPLRHRTNRLPRL
jgi:hypothetical protein